MKGDFYKIFVIVISSIFIGIISGLFGGGGGMLCIPLLKGVLDFEDKNAHATTIVAMCIISLPTLAVYLFTLEYDLFATTFITIGVMIGAVIGSKFLKKIPDKTLNILYILITSISAIKILFF